ncbi:MAG: IS66 family insertion sequence element accessory protein TnpB [Pirellulaceae bacterium]
MIQSSLLAVVSSEIYLYTSAVDMRRSFDGLMSIVQSEFKRDVRAGDLFVFINKRGDRLKASFWWDSDGLRDLMKRLEGGTYQRPLATDVKGCHLTLDRVQLGLLLSGIELTSVQRRKRYQPPKIPQ